LQANVGMTKISPALQSKSGKPHGFSPAQFSKTIIQNNMIAEAEGRCQSGKDEVMDD
jgi:hypothetical protein